jgi:tryptophan 2,3-dioxygenase
MLYHDELLFIITHQSFELWFKLALDGQRSSHCCGTTRWPWCRLRGDDLHTINPMMAVLESMSPRTFEFARRSLDRQRESIQFHGSDRLRPARCTTAVLERRPASARAPERASGPSAWPGWEQPSLHSAFMELLQRHGVTPAGLYRPSHTPNPHAELMRLAEALLDYEEVFVLQRFLHARLAERHLGHVRGTGMTSGVAYLDAAVHRPRLFPELWEARAELWEKR